MSRHEPPAIDVEIPTSDGLRLQGRYWASTRPTALVVIAHGFGEHGGTYDRVAREIVAGTGAEVIAPDLRGHGRSPGRRGVVRRYEELVSDYLDSVNWAARQRPHLPRFALGHSNGGQVVLRAAMEQPQAALLHGLVVSNPMLRLYFQVPQGKLAFAKVLLKFAPGFTLGAPIEPEKLSRDPSMHTFYTDDPLRHGRISAPFFFGMVEGGERLIRTTNTLYTPSLWIIGGADPIVDPEAARLAFDRLGAPDKTLLLYPEMVHEPFHDKGRDGVVDDLINWLRNRIAEPAASA